MLCMIYSNFKIKDYAVMSRHIAVSYFPVRSPSRIDSFVWPPSWDMQCAKSGESRKLLRRLGLGNVNKGWGTGKIRFRPPLVLKWRSDERGSWTSRENKDRERSFYGDILQLAAIYDGHAILSLSSTPFIVNVPYRVFRKKKDII